jgi:hypothetical protein
VITTDFKAGGNLDKTYTYTFFLNFHVTKGDQQDLQRVATLLGFNESGNSGTYKDKDGHLIYVTTGIPIPLRLSVRRIGQENTGDVYSKDVSQLWSLGGNNGSLLKVIDQIKLEPGNYRVRLETLKAVNELSTTPVEFEIGLPGKH